MIVVLSFCLLAYSKEGREKCCHVSGNRRISSGKIVAGSSSYVVYGLSNKDAVVCIGKVTESDRYVKLMLRLGYDVVMPESTLKAGFEMSDGNWRELLDSLESRGYPERNVLIHLVSHVSKATLFSLQKKGVKGFILENIDSVSGNALKGELTKVMKPFILFHQTTSRNDWKKSVELFETVDDRSDVRLIISNPESKSDEYYFYELDMTYNIHAFYKSKCGLRFEVIGNEW